MLQKSLFSTYVKYEIGTKRRSNCSNAVFMKRFDIILLKNGHAWSLNAI